MKKKTNLQPASDGGEAKPRQHGPLKEKTQITIRMDQALMSQVYAQMKEDDIRITDAMEQGALLWLEKVRHEMPAWTKQVRFMVANTTREQQDLIRGLLIAIAEPEVLALRQEVMPPAHKMLFELCTRFLILCNTVPYADACLEWYSRYGKSAGEIASLEKRIIPQVDACVAYNARYGKSAKKIAGLEKHVGRTRKGA